MNDKAYWKKYYETHPNPVEPSTFAKFTSGFMNSSKSLIELGCGNGRDSVFFARNNIYVTAVDQIESEMDYLNKKYSLYNLDFQADDFTNLSLETEYDYVYSRFTMHSIREEQESKVFEWISNQLAHQGLFFLEVRSINDPMFRKGEQISKNENITTHYRRYLDLNETITKLKKLGLKIIYKLESQGLAKYKNDDPMLIRIVAKKD